MIVAASQPNATDGMAPKNLTAPSIARRTGVEASSSAANAAPAPSALPNYAATMLTTIVYAATAIQPENSTRPFDSNVSVMAAQTSKAMTTMGIRATIAAQSLQHAANRRSETDGIEGGFAPFRRRPLSAARPYIVQGPSATAARALTADGMST